MYNLNQLKSFISHLLKNKLYTFITVVGFAIALMFVIILSLYIEKELNVDRFHQNRQHVYRLANDKHCMSAPPIGPMLVD